LPIAPSVEARLQEPPLPGAAPPPGLFPAGDVLDQGRVDADASIVRLLVPVRATGAAAAGPQEFGFEAQLGEHPAWKRERPSDSVLHHARTISSTWACTDLRAALGLAGDRAPQLELALRRGERTRRARLRELRLLLFPTSGLAFICLGLALADSDALADWTDLAADARFLAGRRAFRVAADGGPEGTLDDLVGAVLDRHAGGAAGWGRPFLRDQALTATVLSITGITTEWERDVVRYVVRNHLRANQAVGAGQEERTRRPEGRLPYAAQQDFLLSIEGTAWVGFDLPATEFFTRTLPDHLRRDYLLAWIFVLQERFFLVDLVEAIAEAALEDHPAGGQAGFARVSGWADRLARFEARGHELHLLQREHHHRYWSAARAVLEVGVLHAEVRDLISRAFERAQAAEAARSERRRRALEARVIAALAVPGILFGFLGVNIVGVTSQDGLRPATAIAALVVALALVAVAVLAGRRAD
jgi:hypothetical protein